MKIEKAWDSIVKQSVTDSDGNCWKVADIIAAAKDLEVMNIPLDHLCIDKVIGGSQIRAFVQHMKMVMEADMQYPIILDQDGSIFDGRHRVALALFRGDESIKAVRFDSDPPPTFVKD